MAKGIFSDELRTVIEPLLPLGSIKHGLALVPKGYFQSTRVKASWAATFSPFRRTPDRMTGKGRRSQLPNSY